VSDVATAAHKRRLRLVQWGLALGLALALEFVCRMGWVRPTTVVPPSTMVLALIQAAADPDARIDFAVTLGSVALASAIAALLGIGVGIGLHAAPRLRRAAEPFIASYYALPLFALYPMLVVVFGVGTKPIIVTGVIYAMMSVVIGTLAGLDRIPRVFRKAAKAHRLGPVATLRRVVVPSCAPEIVGGITLSVSYAFVTVIASEFLLAPRGIGHAIAYAFTSFRTARMYGLMLGLALCIVAVNMAMRRVRQMVGP
jgi:NitT/TauT family transport system permease protein